MGRGYSTLAHNKQAWHLCCRLRICSAAHKVLALRRQARGDTVGAPVGGFDAVLLRVARLKAHPPQLVYRVAAHDCVAVARGAVVQLPQLAADVDNSSSCRSRKLASYCSDGDRAAMFPMAHMAADAQYTAPCTCEVPAAACHELGAPLFTVKDSASSGAVCNQKSMVSIWVCTFRQVRKQLVDQLDRALEVGGDSGVPGGLVPR